MIIATVLGRLDNGRYIGPEYILPIEYDGVYSHNVEYIITGTLEFDSIGRPFLAIDEITPAMAQRIGNNSFRAEITTTRTTTIQPVYLVGDDTLRIRCDFRNLPISSGIFFCALEYSEHVWTLVPLFKGGEKR